MTLLTRVLVLGLCVVLAGCGRSVDVQATKASRGGITESFSEIARTRLERRHLVSMPLTARVERIALEPGAVVKKGEELVRVDRLPIEKAAAEARAAVSELEARLKLVEDTSIEETGVESARANAEAASEQKKSAEALIEAEQWRVRRTGREWERLQNVPEGMAVSQSQLDDAEMAAETAQIELRRREYDLAQANARLVAAGQGAREMERVLDRKSLEQDALRSQLDAARERLARAEHDLELASIVSPIDGVVLEKYEIGGGPLASGQQLFLLGDLDELEVESEVLTQDAMKLRPGNPVVFTLSSSGLEMTGKVRLVRPAGFVKFSSLGVEQQRVLAICTIDKRPANLGMGFRVQARFIVGSKENALVVPRYSVLQTPDETFFVFKIVKRRLVKQAVTLGLRSDSELEITSGLEEGDEVVATPDSALIEGMRVTVVK